MNTYWRQLTQTTALTRFRNFIQIAGVLDEGEANMLQQCGVEFLGFPLRLPIHQQDLSDECASKIIRQIKAPCAGVLITYLDEAQEIDKFCRYLGSHIVQVHGDISVQQLAKLMEFHPKLTIIKSLVIGLRNFETLTQTIVQLSPYVDAFITDTYDPSTGATGATGLTHDWRISKQLVELSSKPVILAGGLTPENIRNAIAEVRPAGVDSHTGVEDSSGRKCRSKVEKFIKEAHLGFQKI